MVVSLGIHAIMDVASAEQTVHFAVLYDDAPYGCNALHRLAHQSLVLNTATIVGEAGNKRTQLLNIYKFTLAFLAEGDACIWMNANEAVARNNGCLQGQMLECVRSGIEVGHGEHITVAGTHSRTRAGEDTLLVFKTGLAEVNMQIHQCRNLYMTKQTIHLILYRLYFLKEAVSRNRLQRYCFFLT